MNTPARRLKEKSEDNERSVPVREIIKIKIYEQLRYTYRNLGNDRINGFNWKNTKMGITFEEIKDMDSEMEVLEDNLPVWNLTIVSDNGEGAEVEYSDTCEANSKASAAQIFYARLPDTYKLNYDVVDLEEEVYED